MPSHDERVRLNYLCPVCDGDGKTSDYEGWYECYECSGSGIVLTPLKPKASSRPLSLVEAMCAEESLRLLARNLTMTSSINRLFTVEGRRTGDEPI